MATTERLLGASIKRREDPRFITGRGQYVDDVKLPLMTYAAFVRSPHAHARIRSIDTSAAEPLPGISDARKAHEKSAAQLFDEIPSNECFYWTIGDKAATDAAFASAARVVKQPIVNQRLIPNAMEPRACVASFS